jgi:hypothetical protein
VFGNVEFLRLAPLEELRTPDRIKEERDLDSEEILRKSSIASDLERIIL